MAKNTICLWYDKDAEAAAPHYISRQCRGGRPPCTEGDVLTVEFSVAGVSCLGLNGGPMFKHNEAFSFQIATDDQDETDRYWNAIVGNGGQESACGWIVPAKYSTTFVPCSAKPTKDTNRSM